MKQEDIEKQIYELSRESWWNNECANYEYKDWLAVSIRENKPITRGLRNNNPGNIIHTNSNWYGLCKRQKDERFCQFTHILYGYRAMLKILNNYYFKYGVRTIMDVVNRWAPESDGNMPKAYARRVCVYTNTTPKAKLPSPEASCHLWSNILLGMTYVENGENIAYDEGWLMYQIEKAWNMLYR